MYKVFYNQRTVFFINRDKDLIDGDKSLKHYFTNRELLKGILKKFSNDESIKNLYIFCKDIESTFKIFSGLFEIIEAAGGLVKNENNQFLAIFRREKWDLPKGKLEKDEAPEQGAVREVQEECGIEEIQLLNHITTTYHTYNLNHQMILKKTYWYKMFYSGQDKLKPQTEEDITEVKWLDYSDIPMVINNTFPSIIEVLKAGEIIK